VGDVEHGRGLSVTEPAELAESADPPLSVVSEKTIMRAAVVTTPGTFSMQTLPEPSPAPGAIVVAKQRRAGRLWPG